MGMDRVEAAGGYAFDGLPRTRGERVCENVGAAWLPGPSPRGRGAPVTYWYCDS